MTEFRRLYKQPCLQDMTKAHFLCVYLYMNQCNKQAFYLSECMLVSQLFYWTWCLSFLSYLSWSLQFIWFLPGGDFRFSVIEVCSAIRSLVLCPWSFVLLNNAYQKKQPYKICHEMLFYTNYTDCTNYTDYIGYTDCTDM